MTPHRMASVELQELEVQRQVLLDKRFIRPSTSPWDASVLFTKREVKFKWNDPCERTFQELKMRLISTPILIVPERGQRYTVYCDTSKNGLGCVLIQSRRVVAYGSRQLKNHERNYPTYDMELVAIIFALKAWRHYVYGEKFEVFLDHGSLKYIFTPRDLNMRQRRGVKYLEEYDYTLHYHWTHKICLKWSSVCKKYLIVYGNT